MTEQHDYRGLACPLDGFLLEHHDGSLMCPQGHCFDLDKHGTVNLLPVQMRKSKNPGDSKEMVAARSRVLSSGFYTPVAEAMVTALHGVAGLIVDAGCGEGYYTAHVCADHAHRRTIGVDISKDAIQAASKRARAMTWCVGTNACMPVVSEAADAVMCLFGFPVFSEFFRILKPNGTVLMVDPAPDHLIELRQTLYPNVPAKPPKGANMPDGFILHDRYELRVTQEAPNAELLHDLVMMTPHGFRVAPERVTQAVAQCAHQPLTLHVQYTVYHKVKG